MKSFQRLIAIPQEEYGQLTSIQQMKQPLVQKMSQLEADYQHIPQSSSNPYEHMINQGSVLEEMKRLKEKIRDDIALGTPKPYRNRALSLYRSIEPHVDMTERGEFKVNDKVLENSRIEDLIQHAVRDRRRHFTPTGWEDFLSLLKTHNIPKSALNRATLDELTTLRPQLVARRKTPRKRRKLSPPIIARTTPRKRRQSVRYPDTDFLKDF